MENGHHNLERMLSTFEESYLEEYLLYIKTIKVTTLISLNQHGIDTDGRSVRGVKIFTRQTLIGLSLEKILPHPSPIKDPETDLWDITSIASLSRNLLEGYLSLYYFGIESISPQEAELRFFLLQLHKNKELYEITKNTNPNDPSLKEFEIVISKQTEQVKNHPFLSSLTKDQKNLALRGAEMYKTKGDFERELDVCVDLRRNYRLLSNFAHPLPMSVERINNDRGRGTGSDVDVTYCMVSMMIARKFLAASTVAIADHFPDQLGKKFATELNDIRPLLTAGFSPEKI